MTDRAEIFETVTGLIEPFNKKGVALSDAPPSPAISNGTA
jgi:acyl carrier protein